jgi:hypothetical protein
VVPASGRAGGWSEEVWFSLYQIAALNRPRRSVADVVERYRERISSTESCGAAVPHRAGVPGTP